MADRQLIASSLAASRLAVFETIIGDRFDNIDLSSMMIYLIDVVDSSALPWLASQLDVDSFKGFDQCTTDDQRRSILKEAIDLHRHIGTKSAIEKACSLIGFTPAAINENVPLTIGGNPVWCAFSVQLNPSDLSIFTADSLTMLRQYINYYKNARSILTEIYIGQSFADDIFVSDETGRDNLTLTSESSILGDYSLDYNTDYSS
jgi:P2-related tail formation protein